MSDPFVDFHWVPKWRLAPDVGCVQPGVDPELFFADSPSPVARAICATCPYQDRCRDWGLYHERYGMWGGLVEEERRQVRRIRRIPTPLRTGPDWDRVDPEPGSEVAA